MKINKLFVVSKNKMLLKAIEIACKNAKRNFFTIDDFNEAAHFIVDLKPDVVVIDSSQAMDLGEKLRAKITAGTMIVKLLEKSQADEIKSDETHLILPVNPTSLWRDLEQLLGGKDG